MGNWTGEMKELKVKSAMPVQNVFLKVVCGIFLRTTTGHNILYANVIGTYLILAYHFGTNASFIGIPLSCR